jgi:hypothetical protein
MLGAPAAPAGQADLPAGGVRSAPPAGRSLKISNAWVTWASRSSLVFSASKRPLRILGAFDFGPGHPSPDPVGPAMGGLRLRLRGLRWRLRDRTCLGRPRVPEPISFLFVFIWFPAHCCCFFLICWGALFPAAEQLHCAGILYSRCHSLVGRNRAFRAQESPWTFMGNL